MQVDSSFYSSLEQQHETTSIASSKKTRLKKRVLKLQETASNVPNMTENHGVPGSTPGPAAFYFLSISRKIAYGPLWQSLPFYSRLLRAGSPHLLRYLAWRVTRSSCISFGNLTPGR